MHSIMCPVCQSQLKRSADLKTASCENGHLFDFSKKGYLNLLLNKHKKSRTPGDTKEMVLARKQFLEQGYYQAILDQLDSTLSPLRESIDTYTDIACGEGFYTNHIQSKIELSAPYIGLDISQPAIEQASKSYRQGLWLVANGFRTPIETHSQSLVTCFFARFDEKEICRILRDGGLFISATTGDMHLKELRQALYDQDRLSYAGDHHAPSGLEIIDQQTVRQQMLIENVEDIRNLINMTPHKWRSQPERQLRYVESGPHYITIDVRLNTYRPNSAQIQ